MARIVLTTFGSYGDLYPYLAIGRELHRRGHIAVIAAPRVYRSAVEEAGLAFAAIRPDVDFEDAETMRRAMEPRRGTEYVVRELVIPHLRESYSDLEAACEGANLLASHSLTYAAPLFGEQSGLPWVSTVLSPMVFCSAHDPPALPGATWLARLRPLGPTAVGTLWRLMKKISWSWSEPIRDFRRELGLPADADPFWEGQFSPHAVLALFSGHFALPQPDWPPRTTACGFPFHDADFGGDADAERLGRFLAEGPAPLVFSLGSSAVTVAGDFYAAATEAARRLGQRAVLVVGDAVGAGPLADTGTNAGTDPTTNQILAIRSTAVSPLFDAASIVVHAGGIGTTGQALRAGHPQLVVPFAHDQFDSALRVKRLRLGLTLNPHRLKPSRLADTLTELLASEDMRARAAAMAATVRAEDGSAAACNVLEAILG